MQIFDLSSDFLQKIKVASKLAADTLEMIKDYVQPGVTTNRLNDLCHDYIVSHGAIPAPLGYRGFPKSICTSVNKVICHGIPGEKPLKDGDILNIDVSLSKNGAFADTCKMYFVGNNSTIIGKRIVQCAQECLYYAINVIRPGVELYNVGKVIQSHAKKYRYSVVREFCGHGIGKVLHDEPSVLHYYDAASAQKYHNDLRLQVGMVFTIEPMINVGKSDVKILSDGWTAVTKDNSLSAQYEHTILVTEDGFEILTLRTEEDLNYIYNFKN